MKNLLILLLGVILLACREMPPPENDPVDINPTPDESITYLALGDSYTIGESVPVNQRWPVQLADSLKAAGLKVEAPEIIARTGWTTNELAQAIESAELAETYDLVSLLIGVNNQYRGYPFEQYEKEFTELIETALQFAGQDTEKVFVLSIPDYGVTPFGQSRNPEKIAEELDAYNAKAQEICEQYGIAFFDITSISREALNDPELVASDGLHPSGEMYRRWVELIFEEVKEKLE